MNTLIRYFATVFAGFALTGCLATDITVNLDKSIQVLKGVRTVKVAERDLKEIGTLGAEGVTMLKQYLEAAKSQRAGYVISDYYIKLDTRIIGVVESNKSELIGFDVTTENASRVPVTTTHTLLVCTKADLAAALLKHIKSAKP